MPTADPLERFNVRVEANGHAQAIKDFYTAQSSMRENQAAPRVGRDANVARERAVLARAISVSLTFKARSPTGADRRSR